MSVSKNKDTKNWMVRVSYKDTNGNYKQKTRKGFATKKEAIFYEQELKSKLENPETIVDDTFADYFENWCKTYKLGRFSASTEKKYLREIRYVHAYFGRKLLKNITRSDYQNYLNYRGKGNGKDTVEKAHARLKGALKNALADGLITKDPTFGAIMRYDVKSENKVKFWNQKEAQQLFEILSEEITLNNVLLYLLLSTGLRVGEAFGLSWDDIKDRQLSVNRGYDYNDTKDFTDLKTQSSKRTILISKECQSILNQYRLKYQREHPTYLFLDVEHNPSISYNGLAKHLRKTCKFLNVKKLTIHSLRHTHCSLMIFNGVDIQYISKRLGHKDVTITLSTYSHIIDEMEQKENDKIIKVMDELESCKIRAK